MERVDIGVIHGRFQPLHSGHMEYLLAGKERCDFLYIGITNPDPGLTKPVAVDPARGEALANPFTYFERMAMVRDALLEAGIPRGEFEVVPFPINYPELIRYYAPPTARYFATVYDAWGEHKVEELHRQGFDVEVLWVRTMADRLTTGKEIRRRIREGEDWEPFVPAAVTRHLRSIGAQQRLQSLEA